VLVAGASSGIGREIAIHLASDGHDLALLARRRDRLEDLAVALERARVQAAAGASGLAPGGSAPAEAPAEVPRDVLLCADATDREALERAVAEAEGVLGPLDTLVYSAGTARFLPVEETTPEVWDEVLGGNLHGLYHAVSAILPRFRLSGRGHILGVLSIAARQAFPDSTAYTAAKAGALGFLDALRAELRGSGIHVTAILPGATDTPLWDGAGAGWDRTRMMRPEQVARVVAAVLRETTSGTIEEIRVGPVGGPL
jgi:short-subunit dehydrogenase